MLKRILTIIAVVATAGLIMAWGCQSSSLTDQGGSEYYTGDSVPVTINANGGGEFQDLSKDTDIPGSGTPTGEFGSEYEEADVVCHFEWLSELTAGGSGFTTPVITLAAEADLSEIKTLCVEADCGGGVGSCGYSAQNCVGCLNEYLDGNTRDTTLYCVGWVPNLVSSNDRVLQSSLICQPVITVSDCDIDRAYIVETGKIHYEFMFGPGWPEVNAPGGPFDLILEASTWDLDSVDNTPATHEPGLSAAADIWPLPAGPGDDNVDAYNVNSPADRSYIKFLDITAKASAPPSGTQIFDFRKIIETPIQLSGVATVGFSMVYRQTFHLAWHFCSDRVDAGCSPITDWEPFSDIGIIRDSDLNAIYDASPADISGTGIRLEALGDYSFYTASITSIAPMGGYDYVLVSLDNPLLLDDDDFGYLITASSASELSKYADLVLGTKSVIEGVSYSVYEYAFQPMTLTVAPGVLLDNNGLKVATKGAHPVSSFYGECFGSEIFKVSDTLSACHSDSVIFTDDPFPSDYTIAEALAMPDMVTLVEDALDAKDNAWKIDFSMFDTSGLKYTFAFTKEDVGKIDSQQPGALVMKVKDALGYLGESLFLAARDNIDADTVIGLGFEHYNAAIADLEVLTVTGTFGVSNQITGTVNGININPVDFDTDHATTMTALATELMLHEPIANAIVNVNDIDLTGGIDGLNLDVVLSVAGGATPPTIAQSNANDPFDAGNFETYCFAYTMVDNVITEGMMSPGCDGAASVELIWWHEPSTNTLSIFYNILGQYYELTDTDDLSMLQYHSAAARDFSGIAFANDPDMSIVAKSPVGGSFGSIELVSLLLYNYTIPGQMDGGPHIDDISQMIAFAQQDF